MLEAKLDLSGRTDPPTEEEVKAAIEQLKDMGRFSVFATLVILPGGIISLVGLELLARKFGIKGFNLVPTAFRNRRCNRTGTGNMMKPILIVFALLMTGILALQGQKVYKVNYESQADIKVYVVEYESQADLNVFFVEYASQADEDGLWYFVEYESRADKKVYFVEHESQADLKIFIVKYESQAGWRNQDKKSLL
jgi:hypothetical protein